jgi:alpha-1,3-rhamnosyl/mannosyltransferase
MRVLISGLSAAGARTGIGHYTGELVRCMRQQAGDQAIDFYQPDWMGRAKRWLTGMRRRVEAPLAGDGPPGWRAMVVDQARRAGLGVYRWRFQARTRRGDHDLYHEPSFLPIDCDLPTVVTVPDLSVLLHPEWHPADRVAQHQREFQRGVSRAVHVIAISEQGRREIIRELGLPADRVTRTYMGVRPGLRPMGHEEVRARLAALGLPPAYLLHVGTIEPRKNVKVLLRAYCALPAAVRQRYPLVLVGGWGWNSGDVHAYLHEDARHRGVRYVGYVGEADLACLYNGARALVFPSRYEGFGLPPVEMFACGGAVLASTAVAETAGRKACLIDPDDVAGWRDAMGRICTDDDWCRELRRDATDAARPFTWERCAAETLGVYERVVFGPGAAVRRAA